LVAATKKRKQPIITSFFKAKERGSKDGSHDGETLRWYPQNPRESKYMLINL
jgi:hypothetical protein